MLRITHVHHALLPAVHDGGSGCASRSLCGDHRHVCLGGRARRAGGNPEPAPRSRRWLPPFTRSARVGHRGEDNHVAHQRGRPAPCAVRARQARRGPRRGRPDQPRSGLLRDRDRLPGRGVRHVRRRASRAGPSRRRAHRAAAAPVVWRATRPRRAPRPGAAIAIHLGRADVGLRRRHRGGGAPSGPPWSDVLGRVARHHPGGGLPRRGWGQRAGLLLRAARRPQHRLRRRRPRAGLGRDRRVPAPRRAQLLAVERPPGGHGLHFACANRRRPRRREGGVPDHHPR